MKKWLIFLAVVLVLGMWMTAGGRKGSQQTDKKTALWQDAPGQLSPKLGIDMDFGRMPVYFIANAGQMDESVAYYITGKDKEIYFTSEGVTFVLVRKDEGEDKSSKLWVVKQDFVGADVGVKPRGEDKTGAVISYFKGGPEEWRTGIATYGKVMYENLWPGIDLVYRGAESRLKYEFVIHPGADPGMIRMAYRGASRVEVNEAGALEVETPVGGFADGRPEAYQEEDGKKVDVGIEYDLNEGAEGQYIYGFRVGDYDRGHTLILDPALLVYCGYIGGSSRDRGESIAVDSTGSVYITGKTESSQSSFPVTVGPDLTGNGGDSDAFVAKVNSAGTGLVYCGYIGGSSSERGYGIAVDSAGNAYVTGRTGSSQSSFPVTVGPDLTGNGGGDDAFVAKVNSAGTGLVYCGYIGGSRSDIGSSIAVDRSGSAFVSGKTSSDESTFPVTVGPDLTYNGGSPQYYSDAFVAKVNSAGTGLVYCGYIGGSDYDCGRGIAVDGFGNAYITGDTQCSEATFPVAVGPVLTYKYNGDAFIAKVKSDGTGLVYCGYIGGSENDAGYGIAVDSFGNAYVTGITYFTDMHDFPVNVGPDLTHNAGYDAFVAKIIFTGTGFIYCGYIGGSNSDYSYGIAVDGFGNAYVTGETFSSEATFPVTAGPDLTYNAGYDAFAAKINATGTGLIYCGYIGGTGGDYGYDIAVDGLGNAYVTGLTFSSEYSFPVKGGPDTTHNGGAQDAFVAKIYHYIGKNDFNNDGQGDILWRHYGTGGNALWYLNSSGATAGLSQKKVGARTMAQDLKSVQTYQDVMEAGEILYKDERVYHDVMDVNAPYKKGLVKAYRDALEAGDVLYEPGEGGITGDTQELMNPRNREAGVQAISVIGTEFLPVIVDINWRIVGTGDFNRDGNVDILWRHLVNGQNALWYMTGHTVIGTAYLIQITDVNWQIVGTGDLNRDGNVDILWRHYGTGQNVLWYMNGYTNIGTEYLSAITDINWRIVGTGDLNRDGNIDILWRHYGTGENALWYMNGSALTGTAYLSSVADVYWGIEGTGDFNRDGNVDILWRHYVYGLNSLWYMNGSTLMGTENLISAPDVNWNIENY